MDKIHFKNTIVFLIVGLIISLMFFINVSVITTDVLGSNKIPAHSYIIGISIISFIFGSIGWTIDKFKTKRFITILLVIFYIVIFLIFFFYYLMRWRLGV